MMCSKTFEEFNTILQTDQMQTNTKYIIIKTTGNLKDTFVPKDGQRILWDNEGPYIAAGSMQLACQHGKENNLYQKQKYIKQREMKAAANNSSIRRYNVNKPTKKLNCPVNFTVRRLFRIKEVQVPALTKHGRTKQAAEVRTKILAGEEIKGEDVFLFDIPKIDEHKNHTIYKSTNIRQPLDERVLQKITDLVSNGERDVKVISELLKDFVEREIGSGISEHNGRFYPSNYTIAHAVHRIRKELRRSNIDQQIMDETAEEMDQSDGVFSSCIVTSDETEDDIQEEIENAEYIENAEEIENTEIIHDWVPQNVISCEESTEVEEEYVYSDEPIEYQEQLYGGSNKKLLMNMINVNLQDLLSVASSLEDGDLMTLQSKLQNLCNETKLLVGSDQNVNLPVTADSSPSLKQKYGRLVLLPMKKATSSGTVAKSYTLSTGKSAD